MTLIDVPDGRVLEIHEHGPADGPLIVFHNGTPCSGLVDPAVVADATGRGARIVGITRPGYARSTRRPGRRVADIVDDVRAVLDALGADRCVTWGVSGGGPHALACGALLSDRVAAVGCLAGVAPVHADGLDWFGGMGQDNVDEFSAAMAGEETVRAWMAPHLPELAESSGTGVLAGLDSLVSEADRAVLTGGFAEWLAAGVRDAVSTGPDGWVDDDLAFVSDWGFAHEDITVPVLLMQGDQDLMVPPTHGRWQAARIPGVDARLTAEDGHLTLEVTRIPELHEWLLGHLAN